MIAGYSDDERPLTPRMRDVLAAAAAGRGVKATALELGIAEPTVRSIRAAACSRLHAPNTTAAAVIALRNGLIT